MPEWFDLTVGMRVLLCLYDRYQSLDEAMMTLGYKREDLESNEAWEKFEMLRARYEKEGHYGFFKVKAESAGSTITKETLLLHLMFEDALRQVGKKIVSGDIRGAMTIAQGYELVDKWEPAQEEADGDFGRGDTGIPMHPGAPQT